jgi:hypothetical protein
VNTGMRSLALSCVLLYVIVGFVAGVCPSSDGTTAQHQHHQKQVTHALACAWACHASAHQSAVDVTTQIVLIWLILAFVCVAAVWGSPIRLILITARPPPLFSI